MGPSTTEATAPEQEHLKGLNGWLGFSLVLQILNILYLSWLTLQPIFSWPVTTGGIFVSALCGIFDLFFLYAFYFFWNMKKRARTLMIVLYSAALGIYVPNFVFDIGAHTRVAPAGLDWLGDVAGAATSLAWVLYFIRSQRVKNTFVN